MRTIVFVAFCLVIAAIVRKIVRRRRENRDDSRMISLVGLVREPVNLDPAVVAHLAGKAWQADLGNGTDEGPDGFVVGDGPMIVIRHGQEMYLINSFAKPYIDDVDTAAESLDDLRSRSLLKEHTGWFSCDAIGAKPDSPEAGIRQTYRQIARLFAELLDDNTLLIYLPENNLMFPNNAETEDALRSDDPVRGLQETLSLPIVEIDSDHPAMIAAVGAAQREWPTFVAAFNAGAGENFAVKAPVTHSGNTEFIWIEVTCLEGDRIIGKLGNDPGNLGPLKYGSNVHVPVSDLNDWCYFTPEKELKGGFTIKVLQQARRGKNGPGGDGQA